MLARSWLAEDPGRAFDPLHEAIACYREQEDTGGILACLTHGALALFRTGHPGPAAILLEGARAHADRRAVSLAEGDPRTLAALLDRLSALDEQARTEARAASRGLDVAALVTLLTEAAARPRRP